MLWIKSYAIVFKKIKIFYDDIIDCFIGNYILA